MKNRQIRQDARWPKAHEKLQQLYRERAPLITERVDGREVLRTMTQSEFGEKFGIGSQGMVWQYLNGYTPLNYEAAAKFARGLRCTIKDISPEMASELKKEIIPMLSVGLFAALPYFSDLFSCVLCQIDQGQHRTEHNALLVPSAA